MISQYSTRIFLPFVGITVSSRESEDFRNGITKICTTKVSAGVSTGIGDHEEKYEGNQETEAGDEQFEINDARSFQTMFDDMQKGGLQPVLKIIHAHSRDFNRELACRYGLNAIEKNIYNLTDYSCRIRHRRV